MFLLQKYCGCVALTTSTTMVVLQRNRTFAIVHILAYRYDKHLLLNM